MEILLNKSKSISSVNTDNNMSIELANKNKLLANENIDGVFSRYEQYVKERDECEKYRVLINISPFCSNVLFNSITEVTINDGTDDCECLNFFENGWDKTKYAPNAINSTKTIKYINAIRNTEYSNKYSGNFNYHCGFDIFNNHMLRKKIFVHINKIGNDSNPNYYNTISDYLRNSEGETISENIHIKYNNNIGKTKLHLYNTDSLYSLKDAFYNNAKELDGWWGFYNPVTINISNGDININGEQNEYDINNMFSMKKPCEFIDFYPDRSLFSFIPKYNKNRRRIEKNWDYCLTYPYKKDEELINKICGSTNYSVKAKFKVVTNRNGIKLLQCTSFFKHNLDNSSYVNFYYYMPISEVIEEENKYQNMIRPLKPNYYDSVETNSSERTIGSDENLRMYKFMPSVRVYSVGDLNGDNKERIFSVKYDDIKKIFIYFTAYGCFYKKVTNGIECSYYARKFKKIYNEKNEDLHSDINKAAFSTNIYGDKISQIIFTDTVNIKNLYDVNGRKINEIFLTVVKRNAGNKKWYIEKETGSDEVEFSHCFGDLMSGIDFSGVDVNEEPFDYNIHYMHNIDVNKAYNNYTNVTDQQFLNTVSAWGDTILMGMPESIESGITINNDVFYGDIVEFDNALYTTTVISNICHRFNTMQRELFSYNFRDIYQDVITHDDYEINLETPLNFKCKTYYVNDYLTSNNDVTNTSNIQNLVYGNIYPEGYFYVPNFKIKLMEEGELIEADAKNIDYISVNITSEYANLQSSVILAYILEVKVIVDYGFVKGDFIAVYDKITGDVLWGEIKSFKNMILIAYFDPDYFNKINLLSNKYYFSPNNLNRRFFIFWSSISVPTYAKLNIESKNFIWRPLLKMSELNQNNELFNMPFSNGHLYIQKNINFYLKRQDPNGNYGLSKPLYRFYEQTIQNPMLKFLIDGKEKLDFSKLQTQINNTFNTCV